MKILGPKLHKKTTPPPVRTKPTQKKFNPKFILPKKRKCCGG
jgi:hypothetical protein